MFGGFGGGFNGPGGGSTNSGSAPSGKSTSSSRSDNGREGAGGGPGGPAGPGRSSGGTNAGREGAGGGPGGPAGAGRNSGTNAGSNRGGGSMAEGRAADRQSRGGYAADSGPKTLGQGWGELRGVINSGLRQSTNVETDTAQAIADRRARQIGGLIDQTNIALRSNDLMSPYAMESTYDTRYRPNEQHPVSTAMTSGAALSLQGGSTIPSFDPTVDLGTYRTSVPEIDYSMPTAAQAEIDRQERMYPSGPPGMPANFAAQYLGVSAKGGRVAGVAEKGDRVGGSMHGMAAPDPTRFGGALSTEKGDRLSGKGDRLGFGAAMGATTAETDRAAQARAAERKSMNTYDTSVRAREDNARMADLAATRRADENKSVGMYNAAVANSAANAQRADTASTARAAENTSMADMASWGKQVKSVTAAGPGWTDVQLNDGTVEHRKGDRAARNNNPGNLEYGPFARSMGAVGTDGRFAVFGSKEDGVKAVGGWYAKEAKKNPDITLGQAIGKYAPAFENDTHAYTAALAKAGGISPDTKVTDITPDQMRSMLNAQYSVEGNTGFKMAEVSPRTKDYGDVRSYPDTATQFASTYLGKDQKQAQQDYLGSVPDHNWPGNTAPGIGRVGQVQTASAEQGDAASPQQADYTPDPSLTEFPDRPRSNFEKVAAAGIDVGGGLIPGVGLGVGLINGVLSLTGNRTIGERLVDAIATGKGISGTPSKGDPNRPDYQVADSTVPSTTTVPTVESFVDSYLSPPDKTKYPTPYERYDLNRNTYAGV